MPEDGRWFLFFFPADHTRTRFCANIQQRCESPLLRKKMQGRSMPQRDFARNYEDVFLHAPFLDDALTVLSRPDSKAVAQGLHKSRALRKRGRQAKSTADCSGRSGRRLASRGRTMAGSSARRSRARRHRRWLDNLPITAQLDSNFIKKKKKKRIHEEPPVRLFSL